MKVIYPVNGYILVKLIEQPKSESKLDVSVEEKEYKVGEILATGKTFPEWSQKHCYFNHTSRAYKTDKGNLLIPSEDVIAVIEGQLE